MATAQQLADLAAFVASIETSDELQAELDGVNARLEAVTNQKAIVLAVVDDTTYTDAEKFQMIRETLGPQQ